MDFNDPVIEAGQQLHHEGSLNSIANAAQISIDVVLLWCYSKGWLGRGEWAGLEHSLHTCPVHF